MLIIVIESRHLHTPDEGGSGGGRGGARGWRFGGEAEEDVHESHPLLKEKLSPEDKCWKTEPFAVVEECDLCTGELGNIVKKKKLLTSVSPLRHWRN